MNALLVVISLGCMPGELTDGRFPSSNGQFVLELTAKGPSIALREGNKPARWDLTWPFPLADQYRVADSGKWVVGLLLSPEEKEPQLTLHDERGASRPLNPLALLDQEEKQGLEFSDCGIGWLAKAEVRGDTVELEVIQGGNRRPTEERGPTVRITLDALRGTFTRGPRLPRPSIAELIAQHRAEGAPRLGFHGLLRKSELTEHRNDRALCSFFAGFNDAADARVRSQALTALGQAQCASELKAITGGKLRGDDSDLEQLQVLEESDLPAAVAMALTALRTHGGVELLRRRAVILLARKSPPNLWEAITLGLKDPQPGVRDTTLSELTNQPRSQKGFELLLAAARAEKPGEWRARQGVLGYLETNPRDPVWGQQLLEASAKGQLENWPAALIAVGGILEVRGETAAARAMYQRAVPKLDAQRPKSGPPWWVDRVMWCEGKLRLAQMAAGDGKASVAVDLAKEALGNCGETIAAPEPNRYAASGGFRQGDAIARDLIESKGAPLPPRVDPRVQQQAAIDQIKQARALQEQIMNQYRQRADGGR